MLVLLEPDLVSTTGHPYQLSRALGEEAERSGIPIIVQGHRDFQPGAWESPAMLWRRFSEMSSRLETADNPRERAERLAGEWIQQLGDLERAFPQTVFCFFHYAPHPRLARAYWQALRSVGSFRHTLVFNFYGVYLTGEQRQDAIHFLDSIQEVDDFPAIRWVTDQASFRRDVERANGMDLPEIPFFSLLPGREMPEAIAPESRREDFTFFYPSYASLGRGITVALKAASLVPHRNSTKGIRFRLRFGVTRQRARTLSWKIRWHRFFLRPPHEILYGSWTTEKLREEWSQAEATLIPYRVAEFRERTSAVAADSLALGLPFLCAQGTWMARLVEAYGCGELFEDGNPRSLLEGAERLRQNYDQACAGVVRAREQWLSQNSLKALCRFLLEQTGVGNDQAD